MDCFCFLGLKAKLFSCIPRTKLLVKSSQISVLLFRGKFLTNHAVLQTISSMISSLEQREAI